MRGIRILCTRPVSSSIGHSTVPMSVPLEVPFVPYILTSAGTGVSTKSRRSLVMHRLAQLSTYSSKESVSKYACLGSELRIVACACTVVSTVGCADTAVDAHSHTISLIRRVLLDFL